MAVLRGSVALANERASAYHVGDYIGPGPPDSERSVVAGSGAPGTLGDVGGADGSDALAVAACFSPSIVASSIGLSAG